MTSDCRKQSHVFAGLGVRARRGACDLRLVLLLVLMTTVSLSATGQVGPDAPKRDPRRPPSEKAPVKPQPQIKPPTTKPPAKPPPRRIEMKDDAVITLRKSFILIPAGEFRMGSVKGNADERPVHLVRISRPFEMGKYEITQAQWQSIMGRSDFRGPTLPVEGVSWNDAQQFIQKLNAQNDSYTYRLPTEAEWEYACRAGSGGTYAGDLAAMAWYVSNAAGTTHPVGQKEPNAWGLHDMHGNVWEWCQDWFSGDYYTQSPGVDPAGPSAGSDRVLRGGSWLLDSASLRSANRDARPPGVRESGVGLRLVRTRRSF